MFARGGWRARERGAGFKSCSPRWGEQRVWRGILSEGEESRVGPQRKEIGEHMVDHAFQMLAPTLRRVAEGRTANLSGTTATRRSRSSRRAALVACAQVANPGPRSQGSAVEHGVRPDSTQEPLGRRRGRRRGQATRGAVIVQAPLVEKGLCAGHPLPRGGYPWKTMD